VCRLHTPTCLWRWNTQSIPKRRHIKFRRRGITQNYPEEIIQHSEHGESLKSTTTDISLHKLFRITQFRTCAILKSKKKKLKLNFSYARRLRVLKHSDRNEAEYYCWAMTQAAGRSCCGRSRCRVLPGRLCVYLCSWMYAYSIPASAIRLFFRNVILHKSGGASVLRIQIARKKYTIFSFHTTYIVYLILATCFSHY
jgi:hypothetical protein